MSLFLYKYFISWFLVKLGSSFLGYKCLLWILFDKKCRLKWTQITKGVCRKYRPKKRKQSFNPKNSEVDDNTFTSTSAKKLKVDNKQHLPEEAPLQYSIIDFSLVFSSGVEMKKNFVMEKYILNNATNSVWDLTCGTMCMTYVNNLAECMN